MAIYTKTGDTGTTSLFTGERVPKDSLRVNTYGTFDELNAQLSVCEKVATHEPTKQILHHIEQLLFSLCAEIASLNTAQLSEKSSLISDNQIQWLEGIVDTYTDELPPQHSFILNGRYLSAAQIHLGRTICRRAERLLISLSHEESVRPELLKFVNRLSDCLYMLARYEDYNQFVGEVVESVCDRYTSLAGGGSLSSSWPNKNNLAQDDGLNTLTRNDNVNTLVRDDSLNTLTMGNVATILCNAAKERAKAIGVPMVISIVDEKGIPILFYRMDNALLVSNEVAPSKAYTAVAFKKPTHELRNAVQPGQPLFQLESMVERKIATIGGGYPIVVDGCLIGGIGISGGSDDEDRDVVTYALEKLQSMR